MKDLLSILRALLTAAVLTLVMGASCSGGGGGGDLPDIPGQPPEDDTGFPNDGPAGEAGLCDTPDTPPSGP